MRRVCILLALTLNAAPVAAQTTVYVVRHAEKAKDQGENPALTSAGHARAKELARALESVGLKAIYTTKYARNRQTVAPTAKATGLKPTVVKAKATTELAKTLRSLKGQHVLVAGHSNTVPALLKALGVKRAITIEDDDYDNLFVVFIDQQGLPSLSHLHFGATSR